MSKWRVLRDDTDLLEVKQVGEKKYLFLEVLDMKEHTGRGAFYVEVSYVDLNEIPAHGIQEALDSWDFLLDEEDDAMCRLGVAEACHSYGFKALLGSENAGAAVVARRAGRRIAKEALEDLDGAMERPCNAIGSTAAEMMRGDIFPAINRGCAEGKPDARMVAKMYGADPDEAIVDRLPFVMGYLAAMSGQPNEATEDYAAEYTYGYERGRRVAECISLPPSWIK